MIEIKPKEEEKKFHDKRNKDQKSEVETSREEREEKKKLEEREKKSHDSSAIKRHEYEVEILEEIRLDNGVQNQDFQPHKNEENSRKFENAFKIDDESFSLEKIFIFPLSENEKCPSFLTQHQFNLLIGVCVNKRLK